MDRYALIDFNGRLFISLKNRLSTLCPAVGQGGGRGFWVQGKALQRSHVPPHFHAEYSGYKMAIDIRTLELLKGEMPRRALVLLLEWAQEHRAELMENWELCQLGQLPNRIPPLL